VSIGASPATRIDAEASAEAAVEIDVDGRWEALALSELLIPFHSFLVQHTRDRWVLHARPPGRQGEPLAHALRAIAEWQAERRLDASVRVNGRPYSRKHELRRKRRKKTERGPMTRVAIVARLKEGTGLRAAELIDAGPPFDLAETGIARHDIYLSTGEVVFVFEGHDVEWTVDDLIDSPFEPKLQNALEEWRAIVDGLPRVAREQFGWAQVEAEPAAAEAMAGSGT
jgi:hypothetical protein